MADEQNRRNIPDSLVDIQDVKIDRSLPVEERMKSYADQIKNLICLRSAKRSLGFLMRTLRLQSRITS